MCGSSVPIVVLRRSSALLVLLLLLRRSVWLLVTLLVIRLRCLLVFVASCLLLLLVFVGFVCGVGDHVGGGGEMSVRVEIVGVLFGLEEDVWLYRLGG